MPVTGNHDATLECRPSSTPDTLRASRFQCQDLVSPHRWRVSSTPCAPRPVNVRQIVHRCVSVDEWRGVFWPSPRHTAPVRV